MTAEDIDIELLFSEALKRTAGSDRESWVRQATDGKPELRERLSRLLDAHGRASGFLDEPAFTDPFQTCSAEAF